MTLIEQLKLKIATKIMHDRGWKEEDREKEAIEWDLTRDDSQFSMVYEDTDFVIDAFLEELSTIEDSQINLNDEIDEEEEESIFDEYGHFKRPQTHTTTAAIFVFMDAGTGKPRYLKDVRKWLANMDRLGVSDDAEIEGFLHYSHDLNLKDAEKVECLNCQNKDDVLLTVHTCTSGE